MRHRDAPVAGSGLPAVRRGVRWMLVRRYLRRRALHVRGLLHVLVVAFALQLSGVGHAVADAIAAAAEAGHEDADCSDGGKECPPGCPDCHCSHVGSAVVVAAAATAIEFVTAIEFHAQPDTRPVQPPSDQLYRPPRDAT